MRQEPVPSVSYLWGLEAVRTVHVSGGKDSRVNNVIVGWDE